MKVSASLFLTALAGAACVRGDTQPHIRAALDAVTNTADDAVTYTVGGARVVVNGMRNVANRAADLAARNLCRSAEKFGKCGAECAADSQPIEGELIKDCGEGAVCCTTDYLTVEELEAAENDAGDTLSDDYVPDYVDGRAALGSGTSAVGALINRMRPGAGTDEPCWGSRVPVACGQAYAGGRPLGQRMCVQENSDARVTTDQYCNYKRLKEAATAAGHRVHLNSGFRTHAQQSALRRQNCRGSSCSPKTATPGYSRHQNGIAFDIAVAAQPALFRWLRENATKYGFIRTVASENWHWEYRPGQACNSRVRYSCSSPAFIPVACEGANVPGSETAGLVCRAQTHCHEGHISNACSGSTYCCKRVPCRDYPDRTCVLKSEAEFGYDSGQCPGSLYCAKPPRPCDGDASRICRPSSACGLFGKDEGLCGTSGLSCCVTEAPACDGDASRQCASPGSSNCALFDKDTGMCPGTSTCCRTSATCSRDPSRSCEASTHRNCQLYKNDSGQCPGSSTCCRTSAKCSREMSEYDCVDPNTPVPAGYAHRGGYCPGASVCLVPSQ
jgi:hypothetical protein